MVVITKFIFNKSLLIDVVVTVVVIVVVVGGGGGIVDVGMLILYRNG